MDIFIILIIILVSWVYTYIKTCQIMHFKYVKFIVYQLFFNKAVKRKIWLLVQMPNIDFSCCSKSIIFTNGKNSPTVS